MLRRLGRRGSQKKGSVRPQQREGHSLCIPPELIIYTLQNFVVITPSLLEEDEESTPGAIASICLVCRAWYSLGNPLLYRHPMVNTHTLPLLARTLATCPSLCDLVKSLHIEQNTDIQGNAHYVDWFASQRRKENQDNFLTHLFHILSSSPSLDGLSASFVFNNHSALLMDTMTGPWVTSRLRFLTVYSRDTLDFVFSNLAFPFLEVLYLIYPTLDKKLDLPPLPRVHTLRIRQLFCSPEGAALDIASLHRLFPSLRTFEFFGSIVNSHRPIKSLKDTPYLDRLCFLDACGVLWPDYWKNYLSTVRTRDLTFGVLTEYDEPITTWKIPLSIESLTLAVKLVGFYSASRISPFQPLKYVLQLLRNNCPTLGTTKSSLQRLTIWIERIFEEDYMVHGYEDVLDTIRELGRLHGVLVEVKDVSIHHWIVNSMDPGQSSNRAIGSKGQ